MHAVPMGNIGLYSKGVYTKYSTEVRCNLVCWYRMELVQYVGGTWRVGGMLALSRAFGDAYMKASGFNEGISDLSNNYSTCIHVNL